MDIEAQELPQEIIEQAEAAGAALEAMAAEATQAMEEYLNAEK